MSNNGSVHSKVTSAGLLITLGIIFGDIGTSPLYVLKAIVGDQPIDIDTVLGGVSCIFGPSHYKQLSSMLSSLFAQTIKVKVEFLHCMH